MNIYIKEKFLFLKFKNLNKFSIILNWFVFLSIFLVISFFRSNILLYEFSLNPDEAERITNAFRILSYGYSWNSVDGYSSGPLNSIILLWPKIFNIDISYFTTRLTSIFLLTTIVFCIYKIFENLVNKLFAFIFILPLISFYSFTTSSELLHYSSEQLSLFLIVIVIYIIDRLNKNLFSEKSYSGILFLSGLIISSIPFAKLQATPVSFVLWLCVLYKIYLDNNLNKRIYAYFLVSSIMIPLIFFIPLIINGEIHHFYNSYIAWSLNYISIPMDLQTFIKLLSHNVGSNIFRLYLVSTVFLFFIIMVFSKNLISNEANKSTLVIILVFFSSYYIVIAPGKEFPHYIHFIIPILILLLGFQSATLINLINCKIVKLLIYLILLLIFSYESSKMYGYKNIKETIHNTKIVFNSLKVLVNNRNLYSFLLFEDNQKIPLLVWGWMPDYYIEKNIIPASREGMNQNQILNSNLKQYFQERLIDDINQSKPIIIIDAVYKGAFGFSDNDKYGIKSFDKLSSIVNDNYTIMSLKSTNNDKPKIYLENEYLKKFYRNSISIKDIRASDSYDENVSGKNVNDFSAFEKSPYGTILDYWMLPDNTLGNIKFDFYNNEKLKLIKILNTTNGYFVNKSTKEIRINLYNGEKLIYTATKELNKYPLWTDVFFENLEEVTSVSIDILSFDGAGAGLNEVKFYR